MTLNVLFIRVRDDSPEVRDDFVKFYIIACKEISDDQLHVTQVEKKSNNHCRADQNNVSLL